ncbi:M55 family metallopeptidase [Pseudovibrio sp. SPO723]|uniref:M55 family metallopeptidase n=1 Tax=Nesiotobacter zosterae TaxID=392721 RepID=UPI0029C332B3|nr:M55 family metallopeptidase [Pseudovibrio sp. SPO723]MDX5593342.1 M55 family metallopeptidase [Pseudovibrio sp. SPO723]
MRIFISVDIEGVAGVTEALQGTRGNAEYETARRLMTEEANAAIRGAFAGGATEVIVADSHGPLRNMMVEDLDPRARVVSGRPRPHSMGQGLDASCDGAIFIGYHASADHQGVLAHTINGLAFARIEINGVQAGEPTIFGGFAAELGVPLLAVSGDDQLAKEIAGQFPSSRRIVVKEALGGSVANSLSPKAARELIEAEVTAALKNAGTAKPEAPGITPLNVTVHFNKQIFADAAVMVPTVERAGARAVRFTSANHEELIGTLTILSMISSSLA